MSPKPFTIQVPAEVLDDLRSRLARTRWPDPLPYPGWAAGADVGYLTELAAYWASSFDWRAAERHLNSFAQFTAVIGGQRVHFVHQRGRGPDPFPLVLTHGWPSCFAELLKLAPLLTDPAAHGGDEREVMDEYLACIAATTGRLAERLDTADPDSGLIASAGSAPATPSASAPTTPRTTLWGRQALTDAARSGARCRVVQPCW